MKDWWRSCYHLCWQHGLEAQRSIWSSYKHLFLLEESLGSSLSVIFKCLKIKTYFFSFFFFPSSSPKFLELLLQSGILLPKTILSWTMLWSLMYIIVVMWLLLQSISISFFNVCLEIYFQFFSSSHQNFLKYCCKMALLVDRTFYHESGRCYVVLSLVNFLKLKTKLMNQPQVVLSTLQIYWNTSKLHTCILKLLKFRTCCMR